MREFKGRTREFFLDEYSERKRIELFGTESRKASVSGGFGDLAKDSEYLYPSRGVVVRTSPAAVFDPTPELVEVRFSAPNSPNSPN